MKKNIWKQLINEFIKTFQLFLSKIRNSYFYFKTMEDFSKVEGIKTKGGKPYVQNKELMKEIVLSKQRDELTYNAVVMLQLIAENLAKKKHYKCQEDKEDCIQTAMLDVAMYWRSFDPERFNNPFAYYTSMLCNGLSKGWNKIYGKFKASEMTSLDNNIHSF